MEAGLTFAQAMLRLLNYIRVSSLALEKDDLQVSNIINDLSAISSNPSRVCLCFGYQPDCNVTIYELELLPGQSFQIQAVAVGQRFGTVPSTVFAAYENSSTEIDEVQQVQHVGKTCTILNYTIKSPNTEEILKLYVEKYFIPEPVLDDLFDPYDEESKSLSEVKQLLSVFEELKVSLKILKCPLGYSFDSSTNICTCQKTLTRNGIECHLKNQTIVRRNQMWINATFSHTDSEENNPGVIVHHNCPFDYCKNVNVQYLDLRYPNDQCGFGRSGTLCGECPTKSQSCVWYIKVQEMFKCLDSVSYRTLHPHWNRTCCSSDNLEPYSINRNNQWTYLLCAHCKS